MRNSKYVVSITLLQYYSIIVLQGVYVLSLILPSGPAEPVWSGWGALVWLQRRESPGQWGEEEGGHLGGHERCSSSPAVVCWASRWSEPGRMSSYRLHPDMLLCPAKMFYHSLSEDNYIFKVKFKHRKETSLRWHVLQILHGILFCNPAGNLFWTLWSFSTFLSSSETFGLTVQGNNVADIRSFAELDSKKASGTIQRGHYIYFLGT